MFSNLQIRPAKPHRRKPSLTSRSGVSKRRISRQFADASDVPSLSFMQGLFGDEFPETFGAPSPKKPSSSSKGLLDLPAEVLALVCAYCAKLDIKRLRLASREVAEKVDLKIEKVYVSPNRRNLETLERILEHERYRFKIEGVVWDDAQLEEYPDLQSFADAVALNETSEKRDVEHLLESMSRGMQEESLFEHDDFFDGEGRLTDVAKGILLRQDDEVCRDVIARNATVMSVEESYWIYQSLWREEQEITKAGVDAAALRHTLAVCPNLKKITLTNDIWRPRAFQSSNQTPFNRFLPPGFRKPSVYPWFSNRPQATPTQLAHRLKTMSTLIPNRTKHIPSEWRGYSIIVSTLLSMPSPQITDLIIHPGSPTNGLPHLLFATPNADSLATLSLFRTLPLTRLTLAFNSLGANHATHTSYLQSGHLHDALAALTSLQHLDISPNCHARRSTGAPNVTEHVLYWPSILPASLLSLLRTLALRNASVQPPSLFALIRALTRAEHIVLDNIAPINYFEMFARLRAHYAGAQGACSRPAYTVIEPVEEHDIARLVYEECGEYLHNGGVGPWDEGGSIGDGIGWVVSEEGGGCWRVGEGGW